MSWVGLKCLVRNTFLVDFETWYEILCSSLNMQIFDLTCLSLTSITFERIELQSSDWTQKSRFFKLYPNMLSVHFDFILICSFSGEKLKSVFFFDLSCIHYRCKQCRQDWLRLCFVNASSLLNQEGRGSFKEIKMAWAIFSFKSPLGSFSEEYSIFKRTMHNILPMGDWIILT